MGGNIIAGLGGGYQSSILRSSCSYVAEGVFSHKYDLFYLRAAAMAGKGGWAASCVRFIEILDACLPTPRARRLLTHDVCSV